MTVSGKQQVFLVDDDQIMRDYMRVIAESAGFDVQAFDSPPAFLAAYRGTPGCLILDFLMPDMSGLELQRYLKDQGCQIPVILISAFGDVDTVKKAFKSGAIDFLQKPIAPDNLIGAIREAMSRDHEIRKQIERKVTLNAVLDRLTAREHQILDLLLSGMTNKHVARELNLSPRTVEAHRANIMKKMHSSSFHELLCVVSSS